MRVETILCLLVLLQSFTSVQSVTYPILVGILSSLFSHSKLPCIGYYLLDLFGTDSNDFGALTTFWNITSPRTTTASRTGYCGTIILMGGTALLGQNTIMQRTYTSLPTHTYISYILRSLDINQWTSTSDTITFSVDGANTQTLKPKSDLPASTGQSNCGNTNHDFIWYDIVGVHAHSSSSLTLKYVISNTGYATASYGLHNLNILFRTTTPYYTSRLCYDTPGTLTSPCSTDGNHYKTTGGSTGNCDLSCDTCFGPGSSGCFGCQPAYYFNGLNCLQCYSTCATCNGTAANQCTRCNPPLILQPDHTCTSTACVSPYIVDGIGDHKVCIINPCQATEYIFYDTSAQITCTPNCTLPYVVNNNIYCVSCPSNRYTAYNTQGQLYCSANCTSPYQVKNSTYCLLCNLGEYISYNSLGQQICVSNCTDPYYQVINSIYCLICDLDQYIAYNTTGQPVCVDNCSSPYQVKNTIYCLLCNLDQYISYNSSGQQICINNCTAPYQVQNSFFCVSGGSSSADSSSNLLADLINAGGIAQTLEIVIASILGCSNPAVVLIAAVFKILSYIRYMSIAYPAKLQLMLNGLFSSLISFNFAPAIPDSIEDKFVLRQIPLNFAKYEIHSSFFVNYWGIMVSLSLILATIIVLTILGLVFRKFKDMSKLIKQLTSIVKWNFFMVIFCSNFDQIILYTSLDLRTLYLHSFGALFSFLTSIGFLSAGLYVFYLIIYIIRDIRATTNKIEPERDPSDELVNPIHKWAEFQPIYKGYKNDFLIQKIFMFIYLVRLSLFYGVIAYLFDHPLLQTILLIILSCSMLYYIVKMKPFESGLVYWQFLIDEIGIFVTNVSIFILALLDYYHDSENPVRIVLGDIIIYTNISTSIWDNICLVGYIVLGVKNAYQTTKKYKSLGIIPWLLIFLSPYEQGGMDVDAVPIKAKQIPDSLQIDSGKLKPQSSRVAVELESESLFLSNRESSPIITSREFRRRIMLKKEFQKAGLVSNQELTSPSGLPLVSSRSSQSGLSTFRSLGLS